MGYLNPEAEGILRKEREARALECLETRRLESCRIAFVGCGGLGEAVVAEAVCRGSRNLVLVDPDRVAKMNLKRAIWYVEEHVGRRKVSALADEVRRHAPDARVDTVAADALSTRAIEIVLASDLCVASFDNNYARYHLQRALLQAGLPLIDLGAQENLVGGRFAGGLGQIRVSRPGGPCLLCMGLDTTNMRPPREVARRRRAGYLEGTTFTPRRVRSPNAHLALEAVDVMVDLLCGREVPSCLYWDGAARRFRTVLYERVEGCRMCGEEEPADAPVSLAGLRMAVATAAAV